jgi:hypothetical protein
LRKNRKKREQKLRKNRKKREQRRRSRELRRERRRSRELRRERRRSRELRRERRTEGRAVIENNVLYFLLSNTFPYTSLYTSFYLILIVTIFKPADSNYFIDSLNCFSN